MRIDTLELKNFRCFEAAEFRFSPQMNLVAGPNAAGKTALLDALSIAAGCWLQGIPSVEGRNIWPGDVRLAELAQADDIGFEPQYPVSVTACGAALDTTAMWSRTLSGPKGHTTLAAAAPLRKLAAAAAADVARGAATVLPVLCYYGTGRLWLEPRQAGQMADPAKLTGPKELSRLEGYRSCMDPRLSTRALIHWIARQSWIEYQQGRVLPAYTAVREGIVGCIENARHLYFDPKRGEVIVDVDGQGRQPFSNLSDGQRAMLAVVGDIAQRCIRLNPHLGEEALKRTPGIVLIDELELHLHPRWQRRVAEDLRRTFPMVQFICSTHSPQILGQVAREEVLLLERTGKYRHPAASKGLDANDVLVTVMNAAASDSRVQELQNRFIDALDDLDVERGEALLRELRSVMDSPNGALGRWETMLGNTRALLESEE